MGGKYQSLQNRGGVDKFSSDVTAIGKIDRLVDIWNNTDINNRKEVKGCEMINSPDHFHLEELLSIFDVFCEWRNEAEKNKEEFITWQSFEDLSWLIFGIIGIARTYLKKDKSRTMVQRKGGSDVCENEFAGVRERNPKPTILNARQTVARRTGTRTAIYNKRPRSNTSGVKDIYLDEIAGPLTKKSKRK